MSLVRRGLPTYLTSELPDTSTFNSSLTLMSTSEDPPHVTVATRVRRPRACRLAEPPLEK